MFFKKASEGQELEMSNGHKLYIQHNNFQAKHQNYVKVHRHCQVKLIQILILAVSLPFDVLNEAKIFTACCPIFPF